MAKRGKKTFYDWAYQFPPVLCRLLARSLQGKPFTTEELAFRSGLSVVEIRLISAKTVWQDVDLPTVRRFTIACGTDFTDRRAMDRHASYLRGKLVNGKRKPPKFTYLLRSPECESYYKPLYERWARSDMPEAT